MDIRAGDLTDLNACLAIDDSYETEYVWQMEEQIRSGSVSVAFRLAHLPRPMKVSGVVFQDDLTRSLEKDNALFVADNGSVRGFVDISMSQWNQVAHINSLVVALLYRKQGIGDHLLREAIEWARGEKARIVLMDISTKNHPAVCFVQKRGFTFCGFNDRIYPNRDIAVSYALEVR